MPLTHTLVTAPGAQPKKWMLFLHGLLGRGGNWRGIATRLVEARPDWGAVLVDLRKHGGSQQGFRPPHTVAAAAEDLVTASGLVPQGAIRAVLGHSFGGKVALAYLAERAHTIETAWVIDAMPGATPEAAVSGSTRGVLAFLEGLPPSLPSREDLVARARAAGIDDAVGQWLATNLVREGEGFRLTLDLGAMRELHDDTLATDLWSIVERPPGDATVHVVVGERSPVWSPEERARLERAARNTSRLKVHTLPAGHWVHVEQPFVLVKLIEPSLSR